MSHISDDINALNSFFATLSRTLRMRLTREPHCLLTPGVLSMITVGQADWMHWINLPLVAPPTKILPVGPKKSCWKPAALLSNACSVAKVQSACTGADGTPSWRARNLSRNRSANGHGNWVTGWRSAYADEAFWNDQKPKPCWLNSGLAWLDSGCQNDPGSSVHSSSSAQHEFRGLDLAKSIRISSIEVLHRIQAASCMWAATTRNGSAQSHCTHCWRKTSKVDTVGPVRNQVFVSLAALAIEPTIDVIFLSSTAFAKS
mmetsp:Transcript_29114/g.76238  ORF Transcript_29114/g.76238 Transcript_29114/m.76238 type:complete len:259 (-) Transcript_29114:456-1232(-)